MAERHARRLDVVGNDIYGEPRIKWAEQEAYYRRYAGRPFAIPEWGLWGRDDLSYVRDMARFARTHRRLELLVYVNGKPGSLVDLASRPRSVPVAHRDARLTTVASSSAASS
jgi:hypothetical protein